MEWTWHWWLFAVALIICTIIRQISRGAKSAANVVKYGPKADYQRDPARAIIGSIIAGAICATIITALAGFVL